MKRNKAERLKIFIFFISQFLCLNLGFSQTSVPTPTRTTTTPGANPTTTQAPQATPQMTSPRVAAPQATDPSGIPGAFPNSGSSSSGPTPGSGDATGSSSTAMDALLNLVGSLNAGKGKYEEYQSICRENFFDTPFYLDAETQQKRIEELKEKIKTEDSAPNKIKLLKEYIDQRKRTEAQQTYAALKAEKSTEQLSKIAESLYLFSEGDPNRAESVLSKVVIDDPKNVMGLTYLAEIYTKNQKYFEAAAAYFDLVKLTKTSFDLELCEIQTLDSQHKDAEKSCKKAAQIHEQNPYPFIYLGISQREKLNYDEAIKYFKESLRKKQTEMGFSCLGEIFFIKENFTNAVESFKRAVNISPTSSRALLGMAWAQFKDKKILDSLETFKRACSLNRNVKTDLRRAYKILFDEKSPHARLFADQAQRCSE